jgi:hypothetical protein
VLCAHVQATTVRAPEFATLVDRADLIFTGRAMAQRSDWALIEGRRAIVTFVSFAAEKWHKGNGGAVVILQFLGGTVGDVTMEVTEMPRFTIGERAVLFVEGNGVAASPIIGFFHGRFPLRRDAGIDTILKHTGEPLGDVAEIGHASQRRKERPPPAMSHAEFAKKIRDRATRSNRP